MPFIGPRPFTEADAGIFFGRKDELAALTAEVASAQIVLLYAPSGSGKSSLISAGLIPVMRSKGFRASQERLNTLVSSDEQSRVDSLREAITYSAVQSSVERPSLLILDQFEEIIAALTYAELGALVETIYSAMTENPLARIVISFREEYLARASVFFDETSEVSVSKFHLDRLSKRGALEAFNCSLETVGFQVEREAGEMFLEQLAPPARRLKPDVGFEPLYLQLLGSQLWSSISSRGSGGTSRYANGSNDVPLLVTTADVRRLVNFDQAIEIFFNSTIGEVCVSHHITQKAMRDWIDRELVTADETRSMVRRRINDTEGLPTRALDDLVRHGLLRVEPRGEDLWLELAHDQLVERVREFNRIWWDRRVHMRLLERADRFNLAYAASVRDSQRWFVSRMTIWGYSTSVREAGLRLSLRYGRWLPSVQKRSGGELDRLALRAFVISGTLINSLITFYRVFAAEPYVPPSALAGLDDLDAETAKRRLHATALNLGRTEQFLYLANISTTITWARLLARLLTSPVIGARPMDRRRRRYIGVLVGADILLSLARWTVRNGLIKSCLDGAGQTQQSQALRRSEFGVVRRCISLEDVASWSRDCPVLLVLDWRGWVDGTSEFERFLDKEVPLYRDALRARGANVAWCCRSDVRRRGWRDSISGLGFPGIGQRTYYMIEHGNVVAWRTVKGNENHTQIRQGATEVSHDRPLKRQEVETDKRFIAILTSLITSSEAAPSIWREAGERSFKSILGGRRT